MSEFEQKQNELAEFEARLRSEFRRVDAPAGFAARVMARAQNEPVRRPIRLVPRWAMVAVAAVLLVFAGVGGRHVQHERKRQEAEAQFQTAARVTSDVFAQAQAQLQRAGVDLSLSAGQSGR